MRACRRVDQLTGDAYVVAGLSDRTFKHVAHVKFPRHLLRIDVLALVGIARIARDDEQPGAARDRGDDLFDHAVGKIFLLGVAADVLKRQHRDRGFVGKRPVDDFRDLGDEADALAGECADQQLRRAVVPKRSANRVDPRRQRRLRDDPPMPDRLQQIVLADDSVAVPHEIRQQVENPVRPQPTRCRDAVRGARCRAGGRQKPESRPSPD